jgi:hypothetical protein
MTGEFNNRPFDVINQVLDEIMYKQPTVKDLDHEKINKPKQRWDKINETINYLEQGRRFLKGAEAHESGEAYVMADDSLDDFYQNLQLLKAAYPNHIQTIEQHQEEIRNEKQRIYTQLNIDTDDIVNREYNQILQDLDKGVIESAKKGKTTILAENPYHRPRTTQQ